MPFYAEVGRQKASGVGAQGAASPMAELVYVTVVGTIADLVGLLVAAGACVSPPRSPDGSLGDAVPHR